MSGLLLNLTHTSHTGARTGIQRVARALWRELGAAATPMTHDPFLGAWRPLEPWELVSLARPAGNGRRSSQWPALARWRGRFRRATQQSSAFSLAADSAGLIEPEVFSPQTAAQWPALFAHVRGPRVAIFHDAIALRFPELTPPATVARFPHYLRELLQFDGIAANSEESHDSLLGYWQWLGATKPPPVVAIPLGVDLPEKPAAPSPSSALPVVLCVGTLEGRKNHIALLEACEQLWAEGRQFELRLIGHVNAATGDAALRRVRELRAAGRPLRYDGTVSDEALDSAYASCAFTVYPSIAEGFGLPVIESLARGRPCICSASGAIGESARGGGCLMLPSVDASSLTAAIRLLLTAPADFAALSAAAQARKFKSWSAYTRELQSWMETLPQR